MPEGKELRASLARAGPACLPPSRLQQRQGARGREMEDWRDLAGTVPNSSPRAPACCASLRWAARSTPATSTRLLPPGRRARRELHRRASHAFGLYDALLGLGDEPRWRRWERHSGETSRHARHALRGLRSATTHLLGARHLSKLATTRSHRTREVSVHPCRSRVSQFMSCRHELAPRVDVMSALDTASLCFLRGDVSCY